MARKSALGPQSPMTVQSVFEVQALCAATKSVKEAFRCAHALASPAPSALPETSASGGDDLAVTSTSGVASCALPSVATTPSGGPEPLPPSPQPPWLRIDRLTPTKLVCHHVPSLRSIARQKARFVPGQNLRSASQRGRHSSATGTGGASDGRYVDSSAAFTLEQAKEFLRALLPNWLDDTTLAW